MPMKLSILTSALPMQSWGTERLSTLLKAVQEICGRGSYSTNSLGSSPVS